MMKKNIVMLGVSIAVWVASSYFNATYTSASITKLPEEKVAIVQKVAEQFRKDNNWDWACTLDGKKSSLEGIMLAKIANESSYGTKGVGARTNNRGNIHGDLIKKSTKFIHADHSSRYAVFATPEDGLENLAQWLKNRWCSVTWRSSWNYVKGPNAPKTEKNIKDINAYHANVASVVMAYDNNKELFVVDTPQTRAQGDSLNNIKWSWIKDGCYLVKKIRKADYLQIDKDGEFVQRIDTQQENGKTLDLFNCYE